MVGSTLHRLLTIAFAAAIGVAGTAAAGETAADGGVTAQGAFAALRALAGAWDGTAGPDRQSATFVYRVAAGNTVVTETLFLDTPHEMITMYHLDGDDLVATHYCSQGNQPRFRLDRARSSAERLVFEFAGGSNFDPAKDSHVHAGTITLQGDALAASWEFWNAGAREANLEVALQRRK